MIFEKRCDQLNDPVHMKIYAHKKSEQDFVTGPQRIQNLERTITLLKSSMYHLYIIASNQPPKDWRQVSKEDRLRNTQELYQSRALHQSAKEDKGKNKQPDGFYDQDMQLIATMPQNRRVL